MKACIDCKYHPQQLADEEPCLGCFDGGLWEPADKKGMNMSKDNINPDHYKSETSLECIESMELIFGMEYVFGFCICNAWKYVWRWRHKNGVEDLKKAQWYVQRAWGYLDPDQEFPTLERLQNYIRNEINLYDGDEV